MAPNWDGCNRHLQARVAHVHGQCGEQSSGPARHAGLDPLEARRGVVRRRKKGSTPEFVAEDEQPDDKAEPYRPATEAAAVEPPLAEPPSTQATAEEATPAFEPQAAPKEAADADAEAEPAEEFWPEADADEPEAAYEDSTNFGGEQARNESAATDNAVFDEEEDDDQPIFASSEQPNEREGSRRRRRRRTRGGPEGNGAAYSASPVGPTDSTHADGTSIETRAMAATAGGPHPVVFDVGSSSLDHLAIDDFGGKDMADAIALVLGAMDRASGPVSLRQLAEAGQRRGRLASDLQQLQQLQSQIAAAVRADNLRRLAAGQRPRFRFVGGRVALTEWLLTNELTRLESEALSAVERYREAARKAFVRKLQELPGHAFVELVLLVLESIGFHNVRAVRRAGIPGHEAHYTAIYDTGAGHVQSALVVRRDGREIGRERVTELRGAFHHYGPATVGWLVTAGPVLSGAREEAAAPNAAAVVLYDGFGIARLCEKHEIGVVRATMPICVPDLDVLEALRSS